jgi:hypothetical protein
MSREVDVNVIASQIVQAAGGWGKDAQDVVKVHFDRLTIGLAEYERQQVAWLVNFRLAAPVL